MGLFHPLLRYQGSPWSRAHFHCGGVPLNDEVVEMFSRHIAIVSGRYCFHRRCISWSYRKRGYDARTQRNVIVSSIVFVIKFMVNSAGGFVVPGFMNIVADRVFIRRMLVYSARNSRANGPAENSTLNPETNSDSPSVRSKGDRLVSASVDVNHIIAKGHDGISSHRGSCVTVNVFIEYPPVKVAIDMMISPRVTSYEIICATARIAPISGYFEFDDHPDHRTVYVNMLDMAMMNRSPRFILVSCDGMGRGAHVINASVSAIIGEMVNRIGDDMVGLVGSFMISLIPSAIGCRSPMGPTMLGPFRSCMYPRILRSSRVKNATAIRIGIM